MGYTLGLDIGVASVGFGLINNESGEVLEAGARLFSSANPDNNQTRRSNRGARRLNRRKVHRLERIRDLFENYDILQGDIQEFTPYHLRVRGLNEKLELPELYAALYNLAKHRGISYLEDVDVSELKGNNPLEKNIDLLKELYPCQIQLQRYETYGQVRGMIEFQSLSGEIDYLVNIFPTPAYKAEAETIIRKQMEFYSQLNEDFLKEYITILTDKREYFVGPGNDKSRTDYGIYRTDGTNLTNLFDILVGKCSIYSDERRGARASYTAQLFDFLNDMNNLTVAGEKLTFEQKQQIYNEIMSAKSVNVIKFIMKVTHCKKDDIKGYRVDSKQKPEFHSFEGYRKLRNHLLLTLDFQLDDVSREDRDKIAEVLTLNTEYMQIINQLKEQVNILSEELCEEIASFRKSCGSLFSKWHSLSVKAMREIEEELWQTSYNQMQLFTQNGVFKSKSERFKNLKYIPTELLLEEIYNPVVKGSIRESIKVINAILKKYGTLDAIVIEMPRETNEKEEKQKIEKMQKANANQKKSAIAKAKEEYSFGKEAYRQQNNLDLKLRLWYEQKQRCLYSGKTITIYDLVNNPHLFDIDHIIPKSISYDDSLNNKVLCYASENRQKGQTTPYKYFMRKSNSDWNYEQYKSYIMTSLYIDGKGEMPRSKVDYLLFEEDLNKYEVRQQFINRNLNDTRYASKMVLNTLQSFMKENYEHTKVAVVRGKFTAQLRRKWKIVKNREESHSHHAIDALIIASVPHLNLWKKAKNQVLSEKVIYDEQTGEVLNQDYDSLVYQEPFSKYFIQLEQVLTNCKYSYKVDRKPNRQVADATIYSTRTGVVKDSKGDKSFKIDVDSEEHYVVAKIKDIYQDNDAKRFMDRYKKDKTQFLMYHHDPQTFKILEEVMKTYSTSKNPFADYAKEYGTIRKYSKKNNGPEIRSIKYYDSRLGQHIELQPGQSKSKKVVLQSLNPWRSDLYYHKKEQRYIVAGLKYADLSFQKGMGEYGISYEKYQHILQLEGIHLTIEEIKDLIENNQEPQEYSFCFSLYKNDFIQWQDEENVLQQYRFLSRNLSSKNMVEVKPIDKAKFDKQAQGLKTIRKDIECIQKVSVDVLGYQHIINFEKLKLTFK